MFKIIKSQGWALARSLLYLTLPLATLSCLITSRAEAQVVEDGTTSTIVNQDGNNFTINQGDRNRH